MGDVYSLVMIDMPLVYEDITFLGDIEAIQCCVPCCAEEERGLCQAQDPENQGTSLGASCSYLYRTPRACPPLEGNVRRREEGEIILPLPWLLFFHFNKCVLYFCLCLVNALGHSLEYWGVPSLAEESGLSLWE